VSRHQNERSRQVRQITTRSNQSHQRKVYTTRKTKEMDYNEEHIAVEINMDAPVVSDVREVPTGRLRKPSSPRMHSETVSAPTGLQGEQGHLHMSQHHWRTQNGYFWTAKVRPDFDIPDRYELFLLGDGERKIEMETITRKFHTPFRRDNCKTDLLTHPE
jgi:hypothetical protein